MFTFQFDDDDGNNHKIEPVRAVAIEALSECYTVSVDFLVPEPPWRSGTTGFDISDTLLKPARVTFSAGSTHDGDNTKYRTFSGVVAETSFKGTIARKIINDYGTETTINMCLCGLVLVPRLRLLDSMRRSRVFCDGNYWYGMDVIRKIIGTAPVPIPEYDTITTPTKEQKQADTDGTNYPYPCLDKVIQYAESDLNFLSRHAESSGIFYFFDNEHLEGSRFTERARFVDSSLSCPWANGTENFTLSYLPDCTDDTPAIRSLTARMRLTTKEVRLRERNDAKPEMHLDETTAEPTPADTPFGRVSQIGMSDFVEEEGCYDPTWLRKLAAVRLQQAQCKRFVIEATSNCASLHAGHLFKLAADNYHLSANGACLVTAVEHRARNSVSGVQFLPDEEGDSSSSYTNTFTAILSNNDVPFRPERRTPRPSIPGLLRAVISGPKQATTQKHASLDDLGYYRIVLPFDAVQRSENADNSFPARLITPYGGPPYGEVGVGFHFPLPVGTQVMVAFVNGDPDRPIIVGPAYDATQKSVITSKNQYENAIQTASGIVMKFKDRKPS